MQVSDKATTSVTSSTNISTDKTLQGLNKMCCLVRPELLKNKQMVMETTHLFVYLFFTNHPKIRSQFMTYLITVVRRNNRVRILREREAGYNLHQGSKVYLFAAKCKTFRICLEDRINKPINWVTTGRVTQQMKFIIE